MRNMSVPVKLSVIFKRNLSFLTKRKVGRVLCLGMNKPERKNTLNLSNVIELKAAIKEIEKDEDTSVAVIYGERGTFSNGYDPDEFQANPKMVEDIERTGLLENYPLKPIVAAISGYAFGFGFDLALWCDFRIVEETAQMGGYARRFGMPVNDVVIHRMHSMLGLNKALDLMLTGRGISAKEALECGIATRIVACGSGLGQAVNFAHSLSNVPQACLKSDRAGLIHASQKFSPATNKFIMEERRYQKTIAVKEAEEGLHFTPSGDSRQKRS